MKIAIKKSYGGLYVYDLSKYLMDEFYTDNPYQESDLFYEDSGKTVRTESGRSPELTYEEWKLWWRTNPNFLNVVRYSNDYTVVEIPDGTPYKTDEGHDDKEMLYFFLNGRLWTDEEWKEITDKDKEDWDRKGTLYHDMESPDAGIIWDKYKEGSGFVTRDNIPLSEDELHDVRYFLEVRDGLYEFDTSCHPDVPIGHTIKDSIDAVITAMRKEFPESFIESSLRTALSRLARGETDIDHDPYLKAARDIIHDKWKEDKEFER